MSTPSLDLLTVGRISVDLYARQLHVPLAEVESFQKAVGGTATNVAVAAARLGHRSAVFTKVGDDPFGEYVRGALSGTFGVDTRFVGSHPVLRTPLAFAELLDPHEPRIVFYREPQAPDMTITLDDIDLDVVADVPVFWVSAGALAAEPSRSTVLAMLEHRGRTTHTVLDLDWRPMLWRDTSEAPELMRSALRFATMAIGNRAECEVAVGTGEPGEAADRLLAAGLSAALVKQGGDGVLVATADERVSVPPCPVETVCGLGAGDAFGGAICDGLLRGHDLVTAARSGNAAGAIVASRLMCSDAMPTRDEIDELLAAQHRGD